MQQFCPASEISSPNDWPPGRAMVAFTTTCISVVSFVPPPNYMVVSMLHDEKGWLECQAERMTVEDAQTAVAHSAKMRMCQLQKMAFVTR